MKCYNHPEMDAVAICKACGKAICKECAVDVGKGIACKGECEEDVKNINELMKRNIKAYEGLKGRSLVTPMFVLIMGLLFSGFAVLSGNFLGVVGLMGILLAVFGGVAIVVNMRYVNRLR